MQTKHWKLHYKFNILLHVLAWLAFLSLPILFISNSEVGFLEMFRHWEFWFFALCFIIPYYINSYLWTPYIIRKRKYVLYATSILLVGVSFAFWLRPFDRLIRLESVVQREVPAPERRFVPPVLHENNRPFPPDFRSERGHPPRRSIGSLDIASVYIIALVVILGSLFRMVQYWTRSQYKIQQVRHELIKSELAFLKAQVHPHFLFNTLNNIYSLALINDSTTATSIFKLSQLMRYYMDERNEEEVDLKEEIQAIQDFISLQKLRAGTNCTLTERYEGLDIPKKIYPFILLPFIENAFKYGLRASEPCYLDFWIQVSHDNCLMEVKNSISSELFEQPSSGIGLKNTKKLLENLYPNKFKLDIVEGRNEFFVKLLLYI